MSFLLYLFERVLRFQYLFKVKMTYLSLQASAKHRHARHEYSRWQSPLDQMETASSLTLLAVTGIKITSMEY